MAKRRSLADVKKKAKKRTAKLKAKQPVLIAWVVFVTSATGHDIQLYTDRTAAYREGALEALEIIKDGIDDDPEGVVQDVQDAFDAGLFESALKLANVPETDDRCNVEVFEREIIQ